jgi:hypothetical protein
MSNSGKIIIANENKKDSIRMLGAQKELYSQAKNLASIQTIIAVPVPIAISVASILFKTTFEQINILFVLYALTASIAEILLEYFIKDLKKKAALIQEDFDHHVLGIRWNHTLAPEKPDSGMIYRLYKKHIKNNDTSVLQNWYSVEIKKVPTNLATIICQRTNCTYDFALKRRYTNAIFITVVLSFFVLLFASIYNNLSIRSFLTNVLAPSLPIFIWGAKRILANNDSIKNLAELKRLIEGILSNSRMDSVVDESIIRQIQDKIYLNRTLSQFLPDCLFRVLRNSLESEMHFTAEQKVKELKAI